MIDLKTIGHLSLSRKENLESKSVCACRLSLEIKKETRRITQRAVRELEVLAGDNETEIIDNSMEKKLKFPQEQKSAELVIW